MLDAAAAVLRSRNQDLHHNDGLTEVSTQCGSIDVEEVKQALAGSSAAPVVSKALALARSSAIALTRLKGKVSEVFTRRPEFITAVEKIDAVMVVVGDAMMDALTESLLGVCAAATDYIDSQNEFSKLQLQKAGIALSAVKDA